MSYYFIILGIGVATALYYYFNEQQPLTYENGKSWDPKAKYEEKGATCTICLEVMMPCTFIRLSLCKHRFHKRCFDDFMQQHTTRKCPNCRQSFS